MWCVWNRNKKRKNRRKWLANLLSFVCIKEFGLMLNWAAGVEKVH